MLPNRSSSQSREQGKSHLYVISSPRILETSIMAAGFVFKLGSIQPYTPCFYQLALCYNEGTKLTYALLLSSSHEHSPVVPRLLSGLLEQKTYCNQPMLLALLSTELVIDDNNEEIGILDKKLSDLEKTMGQRENEDRLEGNLLKLILWQQQAR